MSGAKKCRWVQNDDYGREYRRESDGVVFAVMLPVSHCPKCGREIEWINDRLTDGKGDDHDPK